MRRTAEDAARTRVALLEAALMAFEEKGWRGATFEHIAERAGVTRGALHHHFRDKRALLVEALEWGWSDYGRRLFEGSDDVAADVAAAGDADSPAAAAGAALDEARERAARCEQDVAQVTRRAQVLRERLHSGAAPARDLPAIQGEIDQLARAHRGDRRRLRRRRGPPRAAGCRRPRPRTAPGIHRRRGDPTR